MTPESQLLKDPQIGSVPADDGGDLARNRVRDHPGGIAILDITTRNINLRHNITHTLTLKKSRGIKRITKFAELVQLGGRGIQRANLDRLPQSPAMVVVRVGRK